MLLIFHLPPFPQIREAKISETPPRFSSVKFSQDQNQVELFFSPVSIIKSTLHFDITMKSVWTALSLSTLHSAASMLPAAPLLFTEGSQTHLERVLLLTSALAQQPASSR